MRVSTYVGTGTRCSSGDGGPATAATIDTPNEFTFDANGALLVSSGAGIRRIDTTGSISTVTGADDIGQPAGLAVDSAGNLFVADGYRSVYRVDTKGILTLFAGKRP